VYETTDYKQHNRFYRINFCKAIFFYLFQFDLVKMAIFFDCHIEGHPDKRQSFLRMVRNPSEVFRNGSLMSIGKV